MNVIVKTTKSYEKEISKLLSLEEQHCFENDIAADPLFWPVIRDTGGVRKARFTR